VIADVDRQAGCYAGNRGGKNGSGKISISSGLCWFGGTNMRDEFNDQDDAEK